METELPHRFPFALTVASSSLPVIPFPNHFICHRRTWCAANGSSNSRGRGRSQFTRTESRVESEYDDPWRPDDYYSPKGSKWWVDDSDYKEDDFDDGFGLYTDWSIVLKILSALGWMVPAVAISLLLGTGPNAFIMALAVPLGQTALTLVFDKLWGGPGTSSKGRRQSATRRKPFASASKSSKSEVKEDYRSSDGMGTNSSWMGSSGNKSGQRSDTKKGYGYGGWDELGDVYDTQKASKETPKRNPQEPQRTSKLSKMRRIRERPLLLRLLFSMFPFLDSWTRFML